MAFGQDVDDGRPGEYTLYIANDNDYTPRHRDYRRHDDQQPNRFFVFAFLDVELPGFIPQQFRDDDDQDRDRR